MKLCTKFECNRAIRGGVIAISMFDLMTLNIALRVPFGSGIIFIKLDLRQLILAWIIAFFWYWYIMSGHDLDRGPLDLELLQNFGCPLIKLRTQFQQNRISYWRFSIFSPCNFSGGARLTNGSQGCVDPTSPNLARTWSDQWSFLHKSFVSAFGCLAAFSKGSGSNLSDVQKRLRGVFTMRHYTNPRLHYLDFYSIL